jgi:hypothetical protein
MMPIVRIISLVLLLLGGWSQGAPLQAQTDHPATTSYWFIVVSPNFPVVRAELQFDDAGQGTFTFVRQEDQQTVQAPLKLLPETVERVNRLLDELRFLASREEYQANRNLSHLGTVTLRVRRGTQEREVSLNYTTNPAMRTLVTLLRGVISQESRVLAIELARRHEPLDLDRQMQALKREVSNGWLAEPKKLLALLEDLRSDQEVLLIARRRAEEIIRKIQKDEERAGKGRVY